jgi:hypothetical protein
MMKRTSRKGNKNRKRNGQKAQAAVNVTWKRTVRPDDEKDDNVEENQQETNNDAGDTMEVDTTMEDEKGKERQGRMTR